MTVVASNFARKTNDHYQTEPWATKALLRNIPSVGPGFVVWEPAAGNHLMADVIRDTGAKVITSDIVTYDRPHDHAVNFFDVMNGIGAVDAIITNPPYGPGNRIAVKFARLALQRCAGWVALLLTAKFDFGNTRLDLFRDNPRFAFKIALIDRVQWFPGETTGTEDHAWYVWEPSPGNGIGRARLIYEGRDA